MSLKVPEISKVHIFLSPKPKNLYGTSTKNFPNVSSKDQEDLYSSLYPSPFLVLSKTRS